MTDHLDAILEFAFVGDNNNGNNGHNDCDMVKIEIEVARQMRLVIQIPTLESNEACVRVRLAA